MGLWTRVKKQVLVDDWSICDKCASSIPKAEFSWLRKATKEWYCHSCTRKFPVEFILEEFSPLSQKDKEKVAIERWDESFWVVIFIAGLFWLFMAAANQ